MANQPFQVGNQFLLTFSKHRGLFVGLGVVLIILGLLAISVSTYTTLASVVFLGALLAIGGVVVVIESFRYWHINWSSFFFHLATGILYLAAGFILITNPVSGAVSLTLLLAIFYIVLGAFRIFNSVTEKMPRWGWWLLNGVIALVLGILILMHWPAASLFIIGLFVGIDLLISGITYIMLALAAHTFTKVA